MSAVPAGARTAAVLFLVHASLVLLNALVWQVGGDEVSGTGTFRAIVRVSGIVLIAAGLFSGARWAWMLGVVFAGLWLLLGIIAAVALLVTGSIRGMSLASTAFLVAALATLGAGWGFLLTHDVRRAYRSR